MVATLRWAFLGRLGYADALALQQRLKRQLIAAPGEHTLLMLEHPPVITCGRRTNPANVLLSDAELRARGVERIDVSRGGDVTYHGPGQLVGYPIRRIARAVRPHVEGMAQALVELLAELGIRAWWDDGTPGVWTEQGKIGAVGVDAREGVAIHGFALNVAPQLAHFALIVPCGLSAPVTSLAALGVTATLSDLATALAPRIAAAYGEQLLAVDPGALIAGAA
ncbi:MAG: lipoyl(octanoyl) transferase LipB [Deltaproteobacteria bacterium]|nr:lipoyl(octanoyl) transferase LipB [Deltaproteobacteria bacterium]